MKKTFTSFKKTICSVAIVFLTLAFTQHLQAQCSTATGCSVAAGTAYTVPAPTCSYQNVAAAGKLGPGEYRSFGGFASGTIYDVSWSTTGTGASASPYLQSSCTAVSQLSGSTSYNIAANRPSAWACTGGTWTFTSSVLQYRIAPPTGANAGADQDKCNTTTFTLTGNSPTVGTGSWSKVSGTGNCDAAGSVTAVTAGNSITCRYTINNGGCTSTDDVVCTNYAAVPTADAGADQSNCNTTTFTLTGNTPAPGTGSWSKVSGTGAVTTGGAVSGVTAGNSITCRYTITNGPCTSSDDVVCTNYAAVTTANAGADQDKCNTTTFTLTGNTPSVGTGSWSKVSGTGACDAAGNVTGVTAGNNITCRYTITNGPCTSSDDVVCTNYASVPTANAGADQSNCNTTTFTLTGNAPSPGTGSWSKVSGTGAVTTGGAVTGVTAGASITCRYTITNGPCTSSDDVVCTNYAVPTANAGADQNNCNLSTFTLAATAPSVGTGAWTWSGTGTITSPSANNSGVTGVTASPSAALTGTWTVTNGPFTSPSSCIVADQVVLTNYATVAAADAGPDQGKCATSTFTLAATSPTVGTGVWTWSGTGSVTTPSANNSGVTGVTGSPSAALTATWTVTNGPFTAPSSCVSSDAVVLTNYVNPDLSPAANPTAVCDNSTKALSSNIAAQWSASSGSFSTASPTFASSNTFNPPNVATPTPSASVTITLTNGACVNATRTIQVDNQNSISEAVGTYAICDNASSNTIFNGDVTGVAWTFGTSGVVNATTPAQNLVITPVDITSTAQNATTTVTATNGACTAVTGRSIRVDNNTTATAGADQAFCYGVSGFFGTFTLAGNDPTATVTGSTGAWTGIPSLVGGFSVASPTVYNSTAGTLGAGNTQTLRWTVTNGVCSNSDDVILKSDQNFSISTVPVSNRLCDNVASFTFNISPPTTVVWSNTGVGSINSGTGVYSTPNIATPTASSPATISAVGGSCSASVNIDVDNFPSPDPVLYDYSPVCSGTSRTLYSDVTGAVWTVGGPGCPACQTPTNDVFAAPTPPGATQGYAIGLANGACSNTFISNLQVDKGLTLGGFVGTPTPVCDVSTLSLTCSPSAYWSITGGGTGALSNVGVLATANTFTPANISGSTQNVSTNIHIESQNGACLYDKAIRTDNQNSITEPAGTYGICDNTGSTTILHGDVNGVAWTFGTGGVVTPTTPGLDLVITPVAISGTTQNATTTVTATNGACPAVTGRTIRVDNNNSIITASPAPVCDNTTQLIDGDVTGVVWSSASGGSVTSPGEDATFTPTALGVPLSANVVVTATNGVCTPKTITMEVRKASTAPTSLTPSTGFVECVGDAFTLTASGATLGYGASYKLYSGSCGGTLVASNGTGVFAPAPGATTTYYARVEGCNTTTCQSATVTANSPLDIIPGTGVKVCVYDGTISGDKYLVNSSNEALLSIDEGSYDLGNVTATVTTYGSVPAQAGSIQCDAPLPSVGPVGGDELYLPRQFDVTTQNTPGGFVTVSLYFTQAELTALANATAAASAAYQSCWGTVASDGSNLMLTIEHSPSSYETRLQGSGLTISAGPWAGTYKATFQVNQFSGFKLHGNGGVNGANGLPVEMIYFEANAINNAFIQLTWATALEINNDGFYVERSIDGQNWSQLDFVNGHDNSTVQQDYSYNDMDVVPGVRYYYRLLQVDNDGQSVHTGIRTAMLNGEVTFNVMDFVPNPTMNQTTLIVTATKEQSITVDIYDVIGQKVMSTVNQLNKGANSIKFDLSKLAAGTYTAGVSAGNETYSKKLIITR